MEALDALVWPVGRLGEAIVGLARLQGWRLRSPARPLSVRPDWRIRVRKRCTSGWKRQQLGWAWKLR